MDINYSNNVNPEARLIPRRLSLSDLISSNQIIIIPSGFYPEKLTHQIISTQICQKLPHTLQKTFYNQGDLVILSITNISEVLSFYFKNQNFSPKDTLTDFEKNLSNKFLSGIADKLGFTPSSVPLKSERLITSEFIYHNVHVFLSKEAPPQISWKDDWEKVIQRIPIKIHSSIGQSSFKIKDILSWAIGDVIKIDIQSDERLKS